MMSKSSSFGYKMGNKSVIVIQKPAADREMVRGIQGSKFTFFCNSPLRVLTQIFAGPNRIFLSLSWIYQYEPIKELKSLTYLIKLLLLYS